jgi:hypothetical protein
VRTKGTDGGKRHADSAVALMNFYAATLLRMVAYGYDAPVTRRSSRVEEGYGERGRYRDRPDHSSDHHAGAIRPKGAW